MGTHYESVFPSRIDTPAYVMEEEALRRNLSLIRSVSQRAGVEIILAFKAFALWKSFPIFREYIRSSTASSVNEALLAYGEMGSLAHTYAPVYRDEDFDTILRCSSHITFNSLTQFDHLYPRVRGFGAHPISCGIRINPEYSEIGTDLYNPAAPGSRLGVIATLLPETLPEGIEGIHFHTHCESDSYALERSLQVIEQKFGAYLPQVSWINMGGGHLMTRADYDVDHLVAILRKFQERHPHLHIILEPGSAFAWQVGVLVTRVIDIVENHGTKTLMIDGSFTCHMPDCLEMPYQPSVTGAHMSADEDHAYSYRIGGNSCLSGDVMGDWYFDHEVSRGELIVFEDMIHYTTVKTNMFNGIHHPSILLHTTDDEWITYREYTYEDYKDRMC